MKHSRKQKQKQKTKLNQSKLRPIKEKKETEKTGHIDSTKKENRNKSI